MDTDPAARVIAHAVVADLIAQYLQQTAATPEPEERADRAVATALRALQRYHACRGLESDRAVAHPVRLTLVTDAAGVPRDR